MALFLTLLMLTAWLVGPGSSFLVLPPANVSKPVLHDSFLARDTSKAVFLTPYIESGNVQEGQKAAKVTEGPFSKFNVLSYSGYLTVNKEYNSNLFFWFFPAEYDYENAPVVVWLQGGPGASSLYGLFLENGPFVMDEKHNMALNPYTWSKNHSIVFIDSPVGTGFSFTDSKEGLSTTISQVADNLHNAVTQFMQLFPELQQLPLFVAGESYGGKYVPALAYTIHTRNPYANPKLNLKGIAVGNGLTDSYLQLHHSEFAYQVGLIDRQQYLQISQMEQNYRTLLSEGYNSPDVMTGVSYIQQYARLQSPYNILIEGPDALGAMFGPVEQYLNLPEVQDSIHTIRSNYAFIQYDPYFALTDWAGSVLPWLEELLDSGSYRVMYFNGQLDIIVAYVLSENMYLNMKFSQAHEYKNANRQYWCVGGALAGYVKTAGTFTEVMVRNAGHAVPLDQPAWAFDLFYRFTRNQLYNLDASCVLTGVSYIQQYARFETPYNFLLEGPEGNGVMYGAVEQYLNLPEVQDSIHTIRTNFAFIEYDPFFALTDWAGSVLPWLEELLDSGSYRVMYFNGQLDIIVAYVLSENMYLNMKFSHAHEYKNANRQYWCVGGALAGYVKTAGTFTEVLVRNAGHGVPLEQPAWAFDLFYRFTRNKLYNLDASCVRV